MILVCQRGRVTRKNAPWRPPQLLKGLKLWFRMTQDNRCAVWCNEAVDGNYGIWKAIYFSVGRYIGSYKSIQNWLSDNVDMFGPRNSDLPTAQIKSLGLLRMEHSWKGHKQVSASQCDVIKDHYWSSIRQHGQRYITACVRMLQTENRGYSS